MMIVTCWFLIAGPIGEIIDLMTPPKVQSVGAKRGAFDQSNLSKDVDMSGLGLDELDPPGEVSQRKPTRRRRFQPRKIAKPKPKAKTKAQSKQTKNKDSANMDVEEKGTPDVEGAPPKGKKQKKKAKTQAKKKVEGEEEEGEEEAQDQEDVGGKTKRRRTCWKKQLSDQDHKHNFVKNYLGSLGVTWSRSQTYHHSRPVDAYAKECATNNGFVTMHVGLVALKVPECLTCIALLRDCHFDMKFLEEKLTGWEPGEKFSPLAAIKTRLGLMEWASLSANGLPQGSPPPVVSGDDNPQANQIVPVSQPETAKSSEQAEEDNVEMNDENEEDRQDYLQQILGELKCFELLPRGTYGKQVPVRCHACRSAKQPGGKIIDLVSTAKGSVRGFLRQHCQSQTHVDGVEQWLKRNRGETEEDEEMAEPLKGLHTVPCTGFSLTQGGHKLSEYREEFKLWATHTNLNHKLNKHTYSWKLKEEELNIFHEKCLKVVEVPQDEEHGVCQHCLTVESTANTGRNAIRFATKYWIARILHARLFQSERTVRDLMDKLKASTFYKNHFRKIDNLLEKSNGELQSLTRQFFVHWPLKSMTDLCKSFIATTVTPMLSVNVNDCTKEFKALAGKFTMELASGQLTEVAKLSAQIGEAACTGKFAQKPAILGLLCQIMDTIDRENRGVESLKRTRKMGEHELQAVQEAGRVLALNGCSPEFMRSLGFNRASILHTQGRVNNLLEQGLPCAALACLFPDVLSQNAVLVDAATPRPTGVSARRFVLCMDFTYLQKLHAQTVLNNEIGVVGGPFSMKDLTGNIAEAASFQPVQDDGKVDLVEKAKANRMLLSWT